MKKRRRQRRDLRPPLTTALILDWADAFRARWGRWPDCKERRSVGALGEVWANIDTALRQGHRGLPGGSSLARLLDTARGKRNVKNLPPLTVPMLRRWAVAHHRRTGDWPHQDSGPLADAPGETWAALDAMLARGGRGLPGGTTLAQFLAAELGVPNAQDRPGLQTRTILAWADAFQRRTGRWPTRQSGAIPESPGDTWLIVDDALCGGTRSLPGGGTLARLLLAERDVPHPHDRPALNIATIQAWAAAHHARTGQWPNRATGPIPEAPGETWCAVAMALRNARRGLPAGLTLARLLAKAFGVRNARERPRLTKADIVRWARAFRQRTGRWPTAKSGAIPESAGDTWSIVEMALHGGGRGLSGGSSIARLLAQHCGKPHPAERPSLSEALIVQWADRHFLNHDHWPTRTSGTVAGVAGEDWLNVDAALRAGKRALPGGSSLARLLARHRGVRNRKQLPRLSKSQIVRWARAHRARTGRWPTADAGAVSEAPGETWNAIDSALRSGCRGLPGGSSLFRLQRR